MRHGRTYNRRSSFRAFPVFRSVTFHAFSPDGKLFVRTSWGFTLEVREAKSGEILHTLEGHSNEVNGRTFSADGKLIVSASLDSTLKVWDTQTGKPLATFFADGPLNCCAIHGEMVVAGGARGLYFLKLVQ